MHIKTTSFVKSATKPANYPESSLPEVAFAGRSNVGKSSLLNVMVQRKSLVRTSSTPGRTQLINFFDLNEELLLVDLPGYGFAKVPMSVKKQWGPMIRTYLQSRENLRAVVMLFDIRRVPRDEDTGLPEDAFTLFSALSKEGRDEIWERVEMALDDATPLDDED